MFARILVTAILLSAGIASAQTSSGVVTGRVVDQSGAALPGVAVSLRVGTESLEGVSDAEGVYRFNAVPAGPVELSFRLINFASMRRSTEVHADAVAVVDAMLPLSLSAVL